MKIQNWPRLLKLLAIKFAGTTLLFSGAIGIGTSSVLLLSSCLGYLPYSDRPGPGWRSDLHWPSWGELSTYLGFAPFFAYYCLFFGLGLFALSVVLGVASAPRWLSRLIGGIIAAMAAGLAVMGAGWYIALAEIGPDAAIALGLLYGVFLFPYFVQPRPNPLRMWIRVGSVSCIAAVFLYWMISPFLPKEPVANITYDLVRVTSGDKAVVAASYFGSGISSELVALNQRGETHGGISGIGGGSGQDAPSVYVELIALEPITKESKLDLPRTGSVIYVLKGGVWTPHPSISKKDGRSLAIRPGLDRQYDGGQVKLGDQPHFNAFTWYPVIPKGL